MNRSRILGISLVVLAMGYMVGWPLLAMFFQPNEMEALHTGGDFLDVVEARQMDQAWAMLAPEAQDQLDQARFLAAPDLPAVIQEFRNAGVDLGPGPTNGLTYRRIGIHINNPPPAGVRIVVTYHDGQVVVSNVWDDSQP